MGAITHQEYGLRRARGTGGHLSNKERAGPIELSIFQRAFGTATRTLAHFVSNAHQGIVDGIHQRQTRRELSRMSDHALADFGIERDQIATVAKGLVDSRRKAVRSPRA